MYKIPITCLFLFLMVSVKAEPTNSVAYAVRDENGDAKWIEIQNDNLKTLALVSELSDSGRETKIIFILNDLELPNSPIGVWVEGEFFSFKSQKNKVGNLDYTQYYYDCKDVAEAIRILSRFK